MQEPATILGPQNKDHKVNRNRTDGQIKCKIKRQCLQSCVEFENKNHNENNKENENEVSSSSCDGDKDADRKDFNKDQNDFNNNKENQTKTNDGVVNKETKAETEPKTAHGSNQEKLSKRMTTYAKEKEKENSSTSTSVELDMSFSYIYQTDTLALDKIYHTVNRLRSFMSSCHRVNDHPFSMLRQMDEQTTSGLPVLVCRQICMYFLYFL